MKKQSSIDKQKEIVNRLIKETEEQIKKRKWEYALIWACIKNLEERLEYLKS